MKKAEETAKDAPHQPTPLWIARNTIRANELWALDTIFPEVMEEDRSSKLKDLAVAQAVGAITHRRMAEQMAKELGFDDYDYDAELEEIQKEIKTLPQEILGAADAMAGAAQKGGGNPAPPGGWVPADAQYGEQDGPLYPRKYDLGSGSRGPLSGASTSRFRKMQKDAGKG